MPGKDNALSLNDSCLRLEFDVENQASGNILFVNVDYISLVDLCLVNFFENLAKQPAVEKK